MDEMETTAPSATAYGVGGVDSTQHEAGLVLGKGKVDGSIPFGSTSFINDLGRCEDMLPGSNEPGSDPVEEYLARGGRITVLEPGAAHHGYSIQIGRPVLAPGYTHLSNADVVRSFFDAARCQEREKDHARSSRGRNKGAHIRQVAASERRTRLLNAYNSGVSIERIATQEGIGVKYARDLLREAGAVFPVFVPTPPTPKPKAKAPAKPVRELAYDPAKLIDLYVRKRLSAARVADALGISPITVRRVAAKAGVLRPVGVKTYTPDVIAMMEGRRLRARELHAAGAGYATIARDLGVSVDTAKRYALLETPYRSEAV